MARIFTAHTPLGDSLKFHSLNGHEEMSRLFDVTLKLISQDNSIPMNAILGQSLTVEIELQDKSRRYFNGYAVEFAQVARDGRHYCYEAKLRPQFWYLTRTRDFKIFQKMSARAIIKQVLSQYGIVIKDQLTGYHRLRDYTVQYGESAFDFVSRLLEEEGAGYWFEHAMGVHTMVLCDSISAYPMLPGYAQIPYYSPDQAATPNEEHVRYWGIYQTVNPGKYATRDYDFKKPKANLDIIQPKPRDHPHSQYEIYNFPGRYRESSDGDNYARVNIEALQTEHERANAQANARGIAPGYRFKLSRCGRADQNREYLIVSADYRWVDNSYESGADAKEAIHDFSFNAQPTTDPYRPERLTPPPDAKGPDSAIVTGPAGEEIWTDQHGRVKVQFHWDRYGNKDENSSCWIRVAHPWAGSSFGGIHIPRIGQEVLIEYINGNPDHPIIVSRVYNADNMPPWGLPANATQSGILTRSSKGAGYDNANALRFEDKAGAEQLWLHAEKDQLTEVEHDEDKWVGNDRRKTIDRDETSHIKHDRTETVDNNETITVHNNRQERVDHNETISIGDNRSEDVGQNETLQVGANRTETIGSNHTETIGANDTINIGANRSVTIGGNKTETVAMMKTETIGLLKALSIGGAYQTTVGAAMNTSVALIQAAQIGLNKSTKVGVDYDIDVGKNFKLNAADSIELTCGKSVLKMDKDGNISVNGHQITVGATGEQLYKADGDITIQAKKILEN